MADTTIPASSRGRAVETRLGFQSALGAIATAWKPVRFMGNLTAGMSRTRVQEEKLGVPQQNTRDIGKRRKGLPGGSLRRVVPLNLIEVGYWWSAAFKRLAPTGADGDFVHTWTSGGDPSNLLSLAYKYENGDFSDDLDVAVAEIQISAAKTEQVAQMSLTLVGLKDDKPNAWPAGALAAAAPDEDFSDWQWRGLWNGVAIADVTNIDLTFNLGVERVNGLSGDAWPTRHHFGDVIITGTAKFYGRAKVWRDMGDSDDVGELTLEAVDPDDPNRFARIVLSGVQFDTPQNEVSGGGQQSADVSFGSSQDADTAAATLSLGNSLAAY